MLLCERQQSNCTYPLCPAITTGIIQMCPVKVQFFLQLKVFKIAKEGIEEDKLNSAEIKMTSGVTIRT